MTEIYDEEDNDDEKYWNMLSGGGMQICCTWQARRWEIRTGQAGKGRDDVDVASSRDRKGNRKCIESFDQEKNFQ